MHIGTHTTQFKRRDSFSESSNSSVGSIGEFVQLVMPLHPPHATQQSSLCFLQEHLRVSQSCLHVHLTTSRRASGAGGRSVILGSRRFRTRSQHHSVWVQIVSFPYPLLHLQIHPSAVVRRCCRCGRQTVQLHSCAAFRHLLVEPSVTQNIQALASLFSVRAT